MSSDGNDTPVDPDMILRRVAAAGVETELPDIPMISDATMSALMHEAVATSLEGQVFQAYNLGILPLSDGQLRELANKHAAAMRQVLRIERTLLTAIEIFDSQHIEYRLLKGVALAHSVYAPSVRSFADADILIHPGQVSAAVAALEAAGARRVLPEVYPGFDSRFAKDITMIWQGVAVDLHRTLIAGPYGERIALDELFDRGLSVDLGPREALALEIGDLFIHAALTVGAADQPPRLVSMADLLGIAAQPDFDASAFAARIREWRLSVPVGR